MSDVTLMAPVDSGRPSRAQLTHWAHMLRAAADVLEIGGLSGTGMVGVSYEAAKSAIDRVTDEMYAANDQAARDAWDQVLGKGAAS